LVERLFDLEHLDAERLRRVADRLRTVGFTEDSVRERLGVDDLSSLRLDAYPHYINERLRRRDRLDLAILLFLLQGVVAVEELGTLLDKEDRKHLKQAGILLAEKTTRTYRAAASLYPLRDRLFFTDHRFAHMPWIKQRIPRDPVMHFAPETYWLARATIRRRARAVLDLGSGSGVQAILAAAHADRAVGIDSNPRAVNFARLNATLNDAWNAVFMEGDLFHPIGGERFDLILASPPSVPAPVYEHRWRDGGPSGADVLRRVVAALPDHLAATGMAQIVTQLGERDGESYLERTRRWLSGANMNIHALKVAEAKIDEYAIREVRATFGDDYAAFASTLKSWLDNLKAQRFTRVLTLVLTFEWNEDGSNAPWTREDESKPPRRAIGPELAHVFQAKRRARAPNATRVLDRCRASVPDDLILIERRRPTGYGFETKDFRVTWKDPVLAPELEVKPLIRDLLERIDNRTTVPEIIARYARDMKVAVEEVDERCRRAFLAMLERGLVTLDEVGVAPARVEAARAPEIADDLISAPAPRVDAVPDQPASSSPQEPWRPPAEVRPAPVTPPAPIEDALLAVSTNEIDDPAAEAKLAEVDGALAALAEVAATDEDELEDAPAPASPPHAEASEGNATGASLPIPPA
jgi:SAM-dependent methyltransferase